MALETGTYISDLNSSNPAAGDAVSAGDDHLRLIKSTVKATFPNVSGAVTATHTELNILDGVTSSTAELNILDGVTATTAELNYVAGVTSAIQTQVNAKAALASPTFTGTPAAPTAAAGTNTTQIATTAFVQTERIGSLKLLKSTAATSGVAVDFIHGTGGVVIDSTYDEYVITLQKVTFNADIVELNFRTTTDATNFDSGASDYQYQGTILINGVSNHADDAHTNIILAAGLGNTSGDQLNGEIRIFKPSAVDKCFINWVVGYMYGSLDKPAMVIGTGCRNAVANVDGFRLFSISGNQFATGTINLYGVVK